MSSSILRCNICQKYTLEKKCSCGLETITPRPAKFSVDDKYAVYRRKAKEEELKKRGLI